MKKNIQGGVYNILMSRMILGEINNTNITEENIILGTDSYKLGHWKLYEKLGISDVFSYFEARKGAKFDSTTFFGLQCILKKLQDNPITLDMIMEGKEITDAHIGPDNFNMKGWEHILAKHGGKLPIRIRAIPEGTEVPKGNVLMTIENTDPECPFLPGHLETILTHAWYPSTVSTLAKEIKKVCKKYLELTSDNIGALDWMLHCFGYRSAATEESAGMGGMGQLVHFKGSDTVKALMFARKYYKEKMAAFSVSATEHSVMTSMGVTGEHPIIKTIVETYRSGLVSLVLDSYNIYKAVEYLTTDLLSSIKTRDGKVVIRPDSGEPVFVLSQIFEILQKNLNEDIKMNSKGFKILPPYIGVIWGDGLTLEKICEILEFLRNTGWSADNIVFGMGGGLLQKVNRDTQAFAFKCSANKLIGSDVWNDVWKDPIDTDSGKTSKRGRLKLIKDESGQFKTVREDDPEYLSYENQLEVVFENGKLIKEYTFSEVRHNAEF